LVLPENFFLIPQLPKTKPQILKKILLASLFILFGGSQSEKLVFSLVPKKLKIKIKFLRKKILILSKSIFHASRTHKVKN